MISLLINLMINFVCVIGHLLARDVSLTKEL